MLQPADDDCVWTHNNRFLLVSSLCFRSGSLTALSAVSSPLYFILMWLAAIAVMFQGCDIITLVITTPVITILVSSQLSNWLAWL